MTYCMKHKVYLFLRTREERPFINIGSQSRNKTGILNHFHFKGWSDFKACISNSNEAIQSSAVETLENAYA